MKAATRIHGWMSKPALRWLTANARRFDGVVEVGSWNGRTTKALAASCPGVVYAVDTWAGTPDDPEQHAALYPDAADSWGRFEANLRAEIRAGRVVPVRRPSLDAAAAFAAAGFRFGMVFIDADHRYEAVRDDIEAWLPLVRPGGIIAGHDYHPNWPGVRRAVDEAFPEQDGPKHYIWWRQT